MAAARSLISPDLRLDDYQPTELDIVCRRCNRHATARTRLLKSR